MSKASEYAEKKNAFMREHRPPGKNIEGINFNHNDCGQLQIGRNGSLLQDYISPKLALELRDWLTETFDEVPK